MIRRGGESQDAVSISAKTIGKTIQARLKAWLHRRRVAFHHTDSDLAVDLNELSACHRDAADPQDDRLAHASPQSDDVTPSHRRPFSRGHLGLHLSRPGRSPAHPARTGIPRPRLHRDPSAPPRPRATRARPLARAGRRARDVRGRRTPSDGAGESHTGDPPRPASAPCASGQIRSPGLGRMASPGRRLSASARARRVAAATTGTTSGVRPRPASARASQAGAGEERTADEATPDHAQRRTAPSLSRSTVKDIDHGSGADARDGWARTYRGPPLHGELASPHRREALRRTAWRSRRQKLLLAMRDSGSAASFTTVGGGRRNVRATTWVASAFSVSIKIGCAPPSAAATSTATSSTAVGRTAAGWIRPTRNSISVSNNSIDARADRLPVEHAARKPAPSILQSARLRVRDRVEGVPGERAHPGSARSHFTTSTSRVRRVSLAHERGTSTERTRHPAEPVPPARSSDA